MNYPLIGDKDRRTIVDIVNSFDITNLTESDIEKVVGTVSSLASESGCNGHTDNFIIEAYMFFIENVFNRATSNENTIKEKNASFTDVKRVLFINFYLPYISKIENSLIRESISNYFMRC